MRHIKPIRFVSAAAVSLLAAALLIVVGPWVPPAAAATFSVTKTADTADGSCDVSDCSLREAVIAANLVAGADRIEVPAGTYVLTRTGAGEDAADTGDLDVTEGVTVAGSGAAATVVSASGDRAFEFHSGASEISALGIRDGDAAIIGAVYNLTDLVLRDVLISDNLGGGITNRPGAGLDLIDSTVRANLAGAQLEGAGLANFGDARVVRSTFTENFVNTASEGGGIVHVGPGFLSIVNSTFSGNRAGAHGGAIAVKPGQTAEILNSTIVFNEAGVVSANGEGGGIISRDSATTALANSIIALNTAADAEPNCSEAGFVELGWVLDNDGDCVSRLQPPSPTHITAADPGVEPLLADNGGPTATHGLEPDSPAVDAGNPAPPDATLETCEADDQRGFARPVGPACDIGSFELGAGDDTTAPTITLTTPPEGGVYARNQVVNADYTCQDEAGGSGLASCAGNVPSGSPIDTASLGAKTFTVDATDNAGNPSSLTHNYSVVDTTAPTITLTTPPEGAVYARNQVVNADYACQDEAGGSGLASCAGDVASGSPIDTASLGAKTFTVNATDNAGNPSSVTHNYSVVYVQPDAQIRRNTDSTFKGNNIYNVWAYGQQLTTSIPPGGTAGFRVLVENDGAVPDDITVNGTGSSGSFTVRYFIGFYDVTGYVTGSGFTYQDLAPGTTQQLTVRITASSSATPGSSKYVHVILTSGFYFPYIWDAVGAQANVA